MQQPPTASESEASHPSTIQVSALPRRSWVGVVGLVLLTVGSLALAWIFPDTTLMHFLWVAQLVPLLYLLLAWWGTHASQSDAS
jgi:NADH:ubiquinone oxidoreductase subunit 4 (subunit M)